MILQSENNEENPKPGPARSGDQENRQTSMEAGNGWTATPPGTAPRLVDRVTALRGLSSARPKEPASTTRHQTLMDINSRDAEIPYMKFEKTARDLVCSLMERQDRMNEEIFRRINDLEYQVDECEPDLNREPELK